MSNKIVILKGSPRERGNSSVLADQVQRGAESQGATVDSFVLNRMEIKPCDACDGCRQAHACIIDDDMSLLNNKILDADVIVLSSPIYWFTFSAQLKLCIDRWYGLFNQNPQCFKGKKIGIVLTYGDDDFYSSGTANAIHTFESMFRFLKADIVGIVTGSVLDIGDAEKDAELMDKAFRLGKQLAK